MALPSTSTRDTNDRPFFIANAVVSVAALSLLAYLLLIREGTHGNEQLTFLPAVNAGLNATSAILLVLGYVAIRRKAWRAHRNLMISAFGASSLFLVSYLTYHALHGDTHYQGHGAVKVLYLTMLATHVTLSAAVVPLALTAFYFAARKAFPRHKKVTRVLLPLWLYVSVTGVLIYFMLRGSYGA